MIDSKTALEAQANLEHVVRRWPELRAELRPGGGNALTGMPGGHEKPSPINLAISDLMHEISSDAQMYAMILLQETTDWRTSTLEMPGLLAAIAARHGHFTGDDDEKVALDFCDWAHEARRKVDAAFVRSEPSTSWGECSAQGCAGELRVKPGRSGGECPECGLAWTIASQREFVTGVLCSRLMTQAEIGRALKVAGRPVSQRTIENWVAKGKLKPEIDDLYPFATAFDLAFKPPRVEIDSRTLSV